MFRLSLHHHQGEHFIASPMKSEEIKKKSRRNSNMNGGCISVTISCVVNNLTATRTNVYLM